MRAERNVLAEVQHHSIVKLYYSFQDEEFLYLVRRVGGIWRRWWQVGAMPCGPGVAGPCGIAACNAHE